MAGPNKQTNKNTVDEIKSAARVTALGVGGEPSKDISKKLEEVAKKLEEIAAQVYEVHNLTKASANKQENDSTPRPGK